MRSVEYDEKAQQWVAFYNDLPMVHCDDSTQALGWRSVFEKAEKWDDEDDYEPSDMDDGSEDEDEDEEDEEDEEDVDEDDVEITITTRK